MIDIATALALLFAAACIMVGINDSVAAGRLSLLSCSLFAMAGVYGLTWPLIMYTTTSGDNPFWGMWLLHNENIYAIHTVMATLFAVGTYVGWHCSRGTEATTAHNATQIGKAEGKVWINSCWSLSAIAALTQLAYAHAYGGLEAQLDYSALVRSGVFDQVPSNSLSFLAPFPKLALVACFGFFGLILSGYRTASVFVGLCISFSISVYVFYNTLWRLGFGMFVFTFVIAVALAKVQSVKRQIAVIFFIGPLLLLLLDYISNALELKPADTTIEFVVKELSFPFGGFFAHWGAEAGQLRAFKDIAMIPVYVLPSSIWGEWIDTADEANTALIMGAPKGHSEVTASIPVDAITFGFMQAHIIGVLFVGFLFGSGLRWLQRALDAIQPIGVRVTFQASMALAAACFPVFYADPSLLVNVNFHWLLGLLVAGCIARITSRARIPTDLRASGQ